MGPYLRFLLGIAVMGSGAAGAANEPPLQQSGGNDASNGETYDLCIDDAVALAQQRSFRTARAKRSLSQNELRVANAKSQYLPKLTTSVGLNQQARDLAFRGNTYAYDEASLGEFRGNASADLSMPIDVGGVIRRQVRQADLWRGIAAEDVANTALDVTLDVQTAYLNALRAQNSADADERVAKEIGDLLARAGPKSSLGSFLQVELANAQQTAQSSRENADNAQDGLKQILRVPPEARLRLTSDFRGRKQPVERDGVLARALSRRPDIKSALLKVKQAQTSMQQASDSRRPTVRVGAFASQQLAGGAVYDGRYDRLRQEGGLVNISVPFVQWDNGQLRRNQQVAQIQREQADADVEELRERVAYDVRQQLLAVSRAENRIRNLPDPKQALQALQRAEQLLLTAPPETAQGLVAQVSNARQAWRSAETATADAYIDYNNAVFRLKRLIGDRDAPAANPTATQIPVQTVGPAFGK
ncbi:outer membrane protein [Sphingomonas sp. F9_3S_D5_B_2]